MTALIVAVEVPADPSGLLPPVTSDTAPFWNGLAQGELRLQGCDACNKARWPVSPVCPHCGAPGGTFRTLSGRGTVFSWVRYHRSYLPEFDPLLPYVSATVLLSEGPRLPARLRDLNGDPTIGQPVELAVEHWPGGRHVATFRPAEAP
ncbi:Zn-ribbon domain-containing OB-fold protein [Muricoccus radiodurans]|uniref:Zn-ribbon domain-containing OB-fold protein n=1 Tax=Muricoccus radiodurans TaxID=2231721 RepID=UPI003CEB1014